MFFKKIIMKTHKHVELKINGILFEYRRVTIEVDFGNQRNTTRG